jgi:FMN reductase
MIKLLMYKRMTHMAYTIIGVSSSLSGQSRSQIVLEYAVQRIAQTTGQPGRVIDLNALSADALLGRRSDAALAEAHAQVTQARILIVATPIYRATYAGQLKVFFDLLPQNGLRGVVVGCIATGAGSGHLLAIDHGLRPLIASVGGLCVAESVYVTDGAFPDKSRIPDDVVTSVNALTDELIAVSRVHTREVSL